MNPYRTRPLGELVADLQAGFACGEQASDGVIQLRMNNVDTEGHISLSDPRRVPREAASIARFGLATDDVVFNNTNSPALVGKSAVFSGHDEPVVFSNHFTRIRATRGLLEPRYLVRWLNLQWQRGRFRLLCNQWVNQASVPRASLLTMEIPLPPLPEQRRIADILDEADAVRRKRKEAIALNEELLRSAFLEMVGPAAPGYSSWPEVTLESIASDRPNAMRTGPFGSDLRHSEFVDRGVAVLGIDNAVQNHFAWDERRYVSHDKYDKLKRYTVRPEDVIVTIMGTTGRSAVVPKDIPLSITTKHLATITLNRALAEPEFISQALHRHPGVLRQIERANRGAIMSGLNLGLIRSLRLALPPIDRQRAFARFTESVSILRRDMELSASRAADLFDGMTQRAFRGELGTGSLLD